MSFLVPFGSTKFGARPPLLFRGLYESQSANELAYYAAFGRFIAAYALAEAGAHIAARHFSGLPEDKARVIFSGMRLNDLAEKLRKLTKGTEHFSDLDNLLTHLDMISKERDKFVHRLVEYDRKGGFKITNRLTVKSIENVEHHNFTIAQLNAMENDCKAIFYRLGVLGNQLEETRLSGPHLTLIEMYSPWRYTLPQRGKTQKQRRANPRSRTRRPPSSPE